MLQLLESSDKSEDPTTFEVGAGDIVGNRLFEVGGWVVVLVVLVVCGTWPVAREVRKPAAHCSARQAVLPARCSRA